MDAVQTLLRVCWDLENKSNKLWAQGKHNASLAVGRAASMARAASDACRPHAYSCECTGDGSCPRPFVPDAHDCALCHEDEARSLMGVREDKALMGLVKYSGNRARAEHYERYLAGVVEE